MEGNFFEANLNTLKEMILDEQKLVTYVSLSRELGIHVNESKLLLSKVIDDIRQKQPDITIYVNYIISGLYDDKKARTTVCTEQEIVSLRKYFKIVFFEHIYSVSKCVPSIDNVAFLAVNKFEDFILCTGLIKSKFCVKHTQEEIGNRKTHCQNIIENEQKPINVQIKKVKKEKKNLINNGNDNTTNVIKNNEIKADPIVKIRLESPKKDLIGNTKQKSDKKDNNKTQKGITGFFNKINNPYTKNVATSDMQKNKEMGIKMETQEIKMKEINDYDSSIQTEHRERSSQFTGNDEDEKLKENKSSHHIKKHVKIDKKRKRVLHVSDSESDDEKNDPFEDETTVNYNSEDEIPPTPSVAAVKISSGIINPKKKRKTVDKTYTDEDGYILTRKEEVYESCSENEENVKENVKQVNHEKNKITSKDRANEKKDNKKKTSPLQKGKQSNLMNFFKKI